MSDILELARQAGISVDKFGMGWNATSDTDGVDIEAFAALVRKDALEEAAVLLDAASRELIGFRMLSEAGAVQKGAREIRTLKEQSNG